MSNLTNKDLQRMRDLMGNKTPINENVSNSAVTLVKKSPNGKSYGIVRENTKYFIKESTDGKNFDFIGGLANKTKNQYSSYEEATKHLNIMFEDLNRTYGIQEGTDILSSDIIEEKRFVLKSKKKSADSGFDFGGDAGGSDNFDFGSSDKGGGEDFNFGGDTGSEGGDDFDFGGEDTTGGEDFDLGGDDLEGDDLGGDEDPIKGIQKMTGKLGQKIRDTEDLSSDTMKWVAKSIISALDLDAMDNEDKKDIIRAVKKKEQEGSDEEFDFMDDDDHSPSKETMEEFMNLHDEDDFVKDEDEDMVDWSVLSDEERAELIRNNQYPGDNEEPMMDWDEDVDTTVDYEKEGPFNRGTDPQYMMFPPDEVYSDYMDDDFDEDDEYCPNCHGTELTDDLEKCLDCTDDEMDYRRPGEEQYMLFPPHEVDAEEKDFDYPLEYPSDYMEDYMDDEDDMYGPSSGIDRNENIIDDDLVLPYYEDMTEEEEYPGMESDWMSDDTYPYHEVGSQEDYMEDRAEDLGHTDYMAKFSKDVARNERTKGRNLEMHEIDTHVRKLQNKLGGSDVVTIDGNKVVGDFGYVEVTPTGYMLHKEGSKFGKKFKFDELGKVKMAVGSTTDYMSDPRMMPAPAPAKPSTKPDTPTKPGKPDTDKPSPSKRPFTPPPHITPGEEPAPKAEDDYMEDYMDDDSCPACHGRGTEKMPIGFGVAREPKQCSVCGGSGMNPHIHSEEEIDEPYTDEPFPYTSDSTLPNNNRVKLNYSYKEKFPFKIDYMGDNDEILGKRNKPMRSPAPAPAKPSTKPGPDVKPGKPDTDKPSPSKRPFSPPPHITPGEEPAPKARFRRNRF